MSCPLRWIRGPGATSGALHHHPPPGCCQSLVNYEDRLLVLFGGGSLHHFGNDAYVYDIAARRWCCKATENSDIVAPRIGHSAVVYKDRMIVYGGQDLRSPAVYADVLELSLTHWRWSLRHCAPPSPDGPGARGFHTAQVVGDCMYVLHGAQSERAERGVWVLDLGSGVWREAEAGDINTEGVVGGGEAVPPRLCGCASAVDGDRIFVFGGRHSETSGDHVWLGEPCYTNALYEYDTRCHTWRIVGEGGGVRPQPSPRYAAAMVVHGGYAYVFGGDANDGDDVWYFDDLWRICVDGRAEPRWEAVAATNSPLGVAGGPSPRSGCAYAYANAALFLVGGERGPSVLMPSESYTSEVFELPLGYAHRLTLRANAERWIGFAYDCRRGLPVPSLLDAYAVRHAITPYLLD